MPDLQCIACGASYKTHKGITLFKLPKEHNRLGKWLGLLGITDCEDIERIYNLKTGQVLCWRHFAPEDIHYLPSGRRVLKKSADPRFWEPRTDVELQDEICETLEEEEVVDNAEVLFDTPPVMSVMECHSPSEIGEYCASCIQFRGTDKDISTARKFNNPSEMLQHVNAHASLADMDDKLNVSFIKCFPKTFSNASENQPHHAKSLGSLKLETMNSFEAGKTSFGRAPFLKNDANKTLDTPLGPETPEENNSIQSGSQLFETFPDFHSPPVLTAEVIMDHSYSDGVTLDNNNFLCSQISSHPRSNFLPSNPYRSDGTSQASTTLPKTEPHAAEVHADLQPSAVADSEISPFQQNPNRKRNLEEVEEGMFEEDEVTESELQATPSFHIQEEQRSATEDRKPKMLKSDKNVISSKCFTKPISKKHFVIPREIVSKINIGGRIRCRSCLWTSGPNTKHNTVRSICAHIFKSHVEGEKLRYKCLVCSTYFNKPHLDHSYVDLAAQFKDIISDFVEKNFVESEFSDPTPSLDIVLPEPVGPTYLLKFIRPKPPDADDADA